MLLALEPLHIRNVVGPHHNPLTGFNEGRHHAFQAVLKLGGLVRAGCGLALGDGIGFDDLEDNRDRQVDGNRVALDQIDLDKSAALAETKKPIDGLSFDANGVTFVGIPFGQCSSAEQLRVSVAMALAMNPKLKVLLIRDGSLLDENSLKILSEMAEASDAQVWMERVSKGGEVSVIIEDGEVKKK